MADGREYRVEHPDFVLAAASDIPRVTLEDPDGSQHYLSALLVTSIERIGPVATALEAPVRNPAFHAPMATSSSIGKLNKFAKGQLQSACPFLYLRRSVVICV